jgi:hypothetical protein
MHGPMLPLDTYQCSYSLLEPDNQERLNFRLDYEITALSFGELSSKGED